MTSISAKQHKNKKCCKNCCHSEVCSSLHAANSRSPHAGTQAYVQLSLLVRHARVIGECCSRLSSSTASRSASQHNKYDVLERTGTQAYKRHGTKTDMCSNVTQVISTAAVAATVDVSFHVCKFAGLVDVSAYRPIYSGQRFGLRTA